MPFQVGAYNLRVREKYSKDCEILSAIGGNVDFLDFVEKTLIACKTAHHNDIASERIALTERFEVKDRIIQGRLEVGDYGRASKVRDAVDAKTVFSKRRNHADALPLFFRLQVPEGRDEALLLIERTRQTSAKSAFMGLLRHHFREAFDGYVLRDNPVLPEGVFDEYFKIGQVQKISFVKLGIPTDIVDLLDRGHEELRGTTEFSVRAPRNGFFKLKGSIRNSSNPLSQIQDLYEIEGFEYDNIRVSVKVGKHIRTIDLADKHALPVYDITEDVRVGPDGNPTYESMSSVLAQLASDIEAGAYATT